MGGGNSRELAGQQKGIMSRQPGAQSIKILVNHWRWLAANGYEKEAASCKRQAASLTRKNYNVILQYKGESLCKQKKL